MMRSEIKIYIKKAWDTFFSLSHACLVYPYIVTPPHSRQSAWVSGRSERVWLCPAGFPNSEARFRQRSSHRVIPPMRPHSPRFYILCIAFRV